MLHSTLRLVLHFGIGLFFVDVKLVSSQCAAPSSEQCSCCHATPGPLNYITDPCDLECDFDKPCRWKNGTNCVEDDFDWPIATSVPLDNWHSIPRGREGQCDPFAYTRGAFGAKHEDNRAILVSDPIRCQVGHGMVKFWYWKTALYPSLRVCIRKAPGPCGILNCIATIHGLHRHEWIMKTVNIPPQTEPFEIVFEARFKHNFDIIGLDKISYSARLCEAAEPVASTSRVTLTSREITSITLPIEPTSASIGVTSEPFPVTATTVTAPTITAGRPTPPSQITFPQGQYTPAPVVITPPIIYAPDQPSQAAYASPGQRPQNDLVPCAAIDCSFDYGSTCMYSSDGGGGGGGGGGVASYLPPGAIMRQWRVANKGTANSLTGIFSDTTGTGMYAFAGQTTNNLDMFVLGSPRFAVNSPSLVEFSYHLAGIQGRLRGCVNGLADCRFESSGKDIKSDARRWRKGSFQLDPGTYTIDFVGDNLGKNYVIGLDNIQLKTLTGSRLQCALY